MTYLLFTIASKHYALPVTEIVMVLPNIVRPYKNQLKKLDYMAGFVPYKQGLVPVVDLCKLHDNHPCRTLLSTRVILINYPDELNNDNIVGLLAEHVTETVQIKDDMDITKNSSFKFNTLSSFKLSEKVVHIFEFDKMLPANLSKIFKVS